MSENSPGITLKMSRNPCLSNLHTWHCTPGSPAPGSPAPGCPSSSIPSSSIPSPRISRIPSSRLPQLQDLQHPQLQRSHLQAAPHSEISFDLRLAWPWIISQAAPQKLHQLLVPAEQSARHWAHSITVLEQENISVRCSEYSPSFSSTALPPSQRAPAMDLL